MTGVDLLSGPALTVVSGRAGVGRSHLLRAVVSAADRRGVPVLALRLAPEDRAEPWYLTGRILSSLGPAGRSVESPAAALGGLLRRRPGLVLVLDDAQWADPESAAALHTVLDDRAGSPIRCVAAVRTGAGDAVPHLRHATGSARVVPLRPRGAAEARALAAHLIGAEPDEHLAAALQRYGEGVPAAVDAVIEGYRRCGALVVAGGRAGLRDPDAVPRIPGGHQVMSPVHRLDPQARAVARALAVLHPFGRATASLIARALDLSADRVTFHLSRLRRDGIARPVPSPVVVLGLIAGTGPYERRRIARSAVEAFWADPHAGPGPAYLADRLAEAGASVDPGRAVAELRAAASGAGPGDASRWWSAAADLSGSATDRAEAALCEAAAALREGDLDQGVRAVGAVLADLPATMRDEAELLTVACGAVAGGGNAARAAELAAADRWPEAAQVMPRGSAGARPLAALIAAVLGEELPCVPDDSARRRTAVALDSARCAAADGDLARAVAALGAAGLDPDRLPAADRCLLDFRAGRWTRALDSAVLGTAAGLTTGSPVLPAAVARVTAEVLLAQGRPVRARAALDAARAGSPPLAHLVVPVVADLHRALGELAAAAREVRYALDRCARDGLRIGAGELLVAAAEGGGTPGERAGDGYHAATVRMIGGDAAAAAEAEERARAMGQPYEVARTLERAVRRAGRDPVALREAYAILGELGALLHRSRIRRLARDRGVTVDGRAAAVAESDRLLAVLIAEGLSNRELASATQSSEKSVEGRLSRLFARTGYRSRVELATAVLAGTFPAAVSAAPV